METWYEFSWNNDGVSITEYRDREDPTVEEEWWFTWVEVFEELTGVTDYAPEIH